MDFLFKEYGGDLKRMRKESLASLRFHLLGINGIGPETADSILLYALDKPVFVVDAYTRRIFYRHNILSQGMDYHDAQEVFTRSMTNDLQLFNEYHALIVKLGKDFCRPTPRCEECPLKAIAYSVKYKCAVCHKALPLKGQRHALASALGHYRCRECRHLQSFA